MDLSCLLGVCAATAQTVAAADPTASAASAASSSASAPAGWREQAGNFIFVVGVLSVVLAQALTNTVVRRYARKLDRLMQESSTQAFGTAAPGLGGELSVPALLAAIESRRRALLAVLVGIVAVYSIAAAMVIRVADPWHGHPAMGATSVAVSTLLFASFSGPVVLLGVSASHFARLFWRWFGPAVFVAVAMQAAVSSVERPDEDLPHVYWAFLTVLGLSAAAVLLREWVNAAAWRRLGAWLRRHWLLALLLAMVVGFGLLLVGVTTLPEKAFLYVFGGCVLGAFAIALCYLTLIDRIRRIVAPLLAAAAFALIGVAVGAYQALEAVAPVTTTAWSGVPALALALLAGTLAGSFVLSWVGLAYEQKVFSDAQFQVFCWMLTVSALVILFTSMTRPDGQLLDTINLWLFGATLLALLGYWAAVRYGLAPLYSNKRLLVLRVFSEHHRGERLLDELEERWRHIGPILLIGGTDVAKRTIDPAKAAHFLRRRPQDIFVPNAFMLHKRVAAMDELPDPDGRYRVNEYFCTSDLWREAVELLLERSDAVIVDLSEFSAARQGTAYELGLLKRRGALPRTVFLTSAETDLDAVCAALDLPAGSNLPAGSVIEVERSVDGRVLVDALVQRLAATPATTDLPSAASTVAPDRREPA